MNNGGRRSQTEHDAQQLAQRGPSSGCPSYYSASSININVNVNMHFSVDVQVKVNFNVNVHRSPVCEGQFECTTRGYAIQSLAHFRSVLQTERTSLVVCASMHWSERYHVAYGLQSQLVVGQLNAVFLFYDGQRLV